jgi:hypothetical protein
MATGCKIGNIELNCSITLKSGSNSIDWQEVGDNICSIKINK